jgi:hypothetical protein
MSREVVLSKLNRFKLTCADEGTPDLSRCKSLLVARKVSEEPRYDFLANVYFVENRVKSIYKYWSQGYEGSDPTRFFETLFAVLSNHERQGGKPFLVEVAEKRDPGIYQQAIYLTSGRKKISIIHLQGHRVDGVVQPSAVMLSEIVD